MRIFIIHNFYQHQGGEDVVFKNETHLLSSRHTVTTYATKNKIRSKGLLQFASYIYNLTIANAVIKEIESFQPDVIHLHNIHYGIGPYLIRKIKKKGLPLVMTFHNYRLICPSATMFHNGQLFTDSIQQNFPWAAVRKKVLDGSLLKTFYTAFVYYFHRKMGTFDLVDRYIVLSQFAKDNFLKSKVGIGADKLVVKPNFVLERNIKSQNKESFFIYIGRLSEEKGIIPLLNSLAGTSFRLKVFGVGSQLESALALIDQHENLQYGGFLQQNELLNELAQAEALIVPSICYEGMPMTILDAFEIGVPVIASDIGILSEMVVPLHTGDVYDPFDPLAIRKTLENWLNLPADQKETIRQQCRMEYLEHYTAEKNVSLLESIYDQAISASKK